MAVFVEPVRLGWPELDAEGGLASLLDLAQYGTAGEARGPLRRRMN